MNLPIKEFREACQTILGAIDTKESSLFSETLELKASGNVLNLNVTNREYYVSVKFNLNEDCKFTAAVNAKLFLSLISKITSPSIDLSIDGNSVKIIGNGNYKLPMIYNNNVLMSLPEINIENVTNTMTIKNEILQSILIHNSKELLRGKVAKPVQNYYYIDEKGCLTFTSGACINNFTLEKPVKMLLGDKIVKLFKLFKSSENINFTMGQDPISEDLIQTKVRFEDPKVTISTKLTDLGLISSVPVTTIRNMATQTYKYSLVVNKSELMETLNRLVLFNDTKTYGKFKFTKDLITITTWGTDNTEEIKPTSECQTLTSYEALLNMANLNLILSGCEDDYVTLCFGDTKAFVIKKNNISDILPELKEN